MTTNSNDKRPTHIVWQVIGDKEKDEREIWRRIGAAWSHRNGGTGMNVVLESAPLLGRVVILERRDEEEAAPEEAAPAA